MDDKEFVRKQCDNLEKQLCSFKITEGEIKEFLIAANKDIDSEETTFIDMMPDYRKTIKIVQ